MFHDIFCVKEAKKLKNSEIQKLRSQVGYIGNAVFYV